MAEIPHTKITVPAVEAKTFDKLYIYNLSAHSPVVGVGSLRLELLPFDGQTLGPASEMVTFSSDKLFEVLAAVPEAAAAFEAITQAIPALLAYQASQAALNSV